MENVPAYHPDSEDEGYMYSNTVDYLPEYVKKAYRSRGNPVECVICEEYTKIDDLMVHLEYCAGENNEKWNILLGSRTTAVKAKAVSEFKSSDYWVNQLLCRLREKLELQYFDSTIDPTCRQQMACSGECKTLSEHLQGNCMNDHQKRAFLMEASVIVQNALIQYSLHLEYKKQIELYLILSVWTPEPVIYEGLTAEESEKEARKQFETVTSENLSIDNEEKYEAKVKDFMELIEKHSERMVEYIKLYKGKNLLNTIVQYRKSNNMDVLTENRDAVFNKIYKRYHGPLFIRTRIDSPRYDPY